MAKDDVAVVGARVINFSYADPKARQTNIQVENRSTAGRRQKRRNCSLFHHMSQLPNKSQGQF